MKDIKGYENLYAATENGQIWSYRRKRFMKISNGNNGYKQVCLTDKHSKKKNMYVHRLIALAWLDNPDNLPEINHKDEDKSNNCVDNLEWCTRQYNMQYSDIAVGRAVECIDTGIIYPSMKEAAIAVGVHHTSIAQCVRGTSRTSGGYHWRYA